jgi:catechol 2,3-dioxygenase-like lactoylglutathione lyase family enzyme
MTMFKRIAVVSYDVSDWERAKRFYDDVLGWPVAWSSDEFGWREYGADDTTHISINKLRGSEPKRSQGGGALVVFSVDNANQVTAALRAKGVKCDDPVTVPGVVKYGAFYDPDGNKLQFAEAQPPPA